MLPSSSSLSRIPSLPAVGYAAYGYSNIVAELTQAEHQRVTALLGFDRGDGRGAKASAARRSLPTASPSRRSAEIAAEHDAQLIVVGSHGWGAARRLLSGSVSTGLVHSAPCPVLVVRGSQQRARARGGRMSATAAQLRSTRPTSSSATARRSG